MSRSIARNACPHPLGGVGLTAKRASTRRIACVGCQHNAKNTVVKNYLYLAERAGAVVHPMTSVRQVRPLAAALRRRHHSHRRLPTRNVHRRAGRLLCCRPRHPEVAAQDARQEVVAEHLRPARLFDPHQLGGGAILALTRAVTSTFIRASLSARRSIPTMSPTSRWVAWAGAGAPSSA